MNTKEIFEKLEELKKQIEPTSTFLPTDLFPETHVWMTKLASSEDPDFENIIYDGLAIVSQTFNIEHNEAKKLLFGTKVFEYNKEQAPIAILFYLYLDRKRKELDK